MNRWWFIGYLLMYMLYGVSSPFVHVDLKQVEQYKMAIQSKTKKYQYIRYVLRAGVTVSVLYALHNIFCGEKMIPLDQVRELTKKCPCIIGHIQENIPEVAHSPKSGLGSLLYSKILGLVRGSAHMGIFLVQQLMAFRLFEVLNIKMETLIRYPGSLSWFIEHQTDLSTLLDECQEKAEMLEHSDNELKSRVQRAKEFILSQWHYIINDIEQVLGYINYRQSTGAVDTQEASTIVSYIVNCTNEGADIMSAHLDDHDTTLVYSALKQFTAELTSLLSRFGRLNK